MYNVLYWSCGSDSRPRYQIWVCAPLPHFGVIDHINKRNFHVITNLSTSLVWCLLGLTSWSLSLSILISHTRQTMVGTRSYGQSYKISFAINLYQFEPNYIYVHIIATCYETRWSYNALCPLVMLGLTIRLNLPLVLGYSSYVQTLYSS